MAKFSFLILFISLQSFGQIAVVSDLDETIKRTGKDPLQAIYNIFFDQKIYAGMDDLFDEMNTYADDLYVVTASPRIARYNIRKLIREHGLPVRKVYTRNFLEDTLRYKINAVKDILSKGYEKVILIGDDTSKDAAAYDAIKKLYPQKVASIYIHKVHGNHTPKSSTLYYTVYEIALKEYQAGRMTLQQVWSIGESFLTKNLRKVFPKFSICPVSFSTEQFPAFEELKGLTDRVKSKIAKYCRAAAFVD